MKKIFFTLVLLLSFTVYTFAANFISIDTTFSADDIVTFDVDTENGKAEICLNDGSQYLDIVFFFSGDNLEAGTYEINDSHAPGTVQQGNYAFEGDDSGLVFISSYYYEIDREGYISIPFFFETGTVTLDYDANGAPRIVCDVENSSNEIGGVAHIEINMDSTTSIQAMPETLQFQAESFDLMGRPTDADSKGLHIIRQGNGSKKVMIRE